MSNFISFDPGLGKLAVDLYTEAYIIENDLANMPQLSRKIRFYRLSYKKILKAMLNNLAFYNGCLAWAFLIAHNNVDCSLSGNPFISLTDEQKKQYAPTELVDFFIEYLPKFKSDLKYYNVKDDSLPENTEKILTTYRNFVSINEGFVNTHKVSDILLPENLSFDKSLEEIKSAIDAAVESADILPLINL